MNVRNRALSSTPAMPSTRSRGNPDAAIATWHIASSGLVTMIRIASGECGGGRLDDGPDDAGVLGQQVVPAHPRLAGQARGHDDDVGAGGVGVVVRADDPGVVADDRRRLGEVEALALRQPLDDVDEDDVGQPGLGDALGGRGADVAGADDGDLVAGHGVGCLLPVGPARRSILCPGDAAGSSFVARRRWTRDDGRRRSRRTDDRPLDFPVSEPSLDVHLFGRPPRHPAHPRSPSRSA